MRMLAWTLLASLALPTEGAGPWEDFTLPNGIRVSMLQADLATGQAMFTLLPAGLLADEPAGTQMSHLAEHLMVASTDPEAEEWAADGILFNGETTALVVRLDTLAPPDKWRQAQRRHAAWLQAGAVDPDLLRRERERVLSELQSTAAQGFTHKWAVAAWTQVVRHGASHVRLRGDVTDTDAEEMADFMSRIAGAGQGVRIVTAGPLPRDELRAAIEEDFAGIQAVPRKLPAPAVPVSQVTAVGARHATWDVPARHYMEWYRLPDAASADRVAADALALLVNIKLQQRGDLAARGGQIVASADLIVPEGRYLLVSAFLPGGIAVEEVRSELETVLGRLAAAQEADLALSQMRSQLEWPDFAALRQAHAGQPGLEWIEAQQALFLTYAEWNMGLERDRIRELYGQLGSQRLLEFARDVLVPEQRSSLLLEPGT